VVLFCLHHSHLGKIRMKSRDDNFVFGKRFGICEVDPDFFFFLRLYADEFFEAVPVSAQALDSHVVFAGGDRGDVDAMIFVGGIDLEDDAGAGAIIPIEDDQYGVLVLLAGGYGVELELDASFADVPGSRKGQAISRLRVCAKEQAGKIEIELFHGG